MPAPVQATCPLCSGHELADVGRLAAAKLIAEWKSVLGIDVGPELGEVTELVIVRCARCSLEYFTPRSVQGSPELYVKLERLEWYYLPRKWEHDVAILDVRGTKRGLEIGCGFGDFVARAVGDGIPFEGCEQNPSAVQVARKKGLTIHEHTAEDLSAEQSGQYDVVCSFQVLEHTAQPGRFLESCIRLLSPGGKLMLGLPNSRSFLGRQFNVLDLPPHHMSRWNDDVIRKIPESFPLRLERILYEPLADLHIEGYVHANANGLDRLRLGALMTPRVRNGIVRLVRKTGMRRFLKGQTLYAVYTRL